MTRISREEILIETTKLEAKRGTCLRAQVGCVIAIEGRVIATGYNGAPPGEPHCFDVGCQMEEGHCVRTIHAEANAICWAARRGVSVLGATLYTYGWKGGICHGCDKLAKSAGIVKIVEIPLEEEDFLPPWHWSSCLRCGKVFTGTDKNQVQTDVEQCNHIKDLI